MGEVVINDVEKGLKDVFQSVYRANCEIEGEEITSEDEQTLNDLDSIEILENLKDLTQDLLNCKRDFRQTDKSELESRCQQFESMLQKLEADVRVHIRIEQQLKLHIEAAQSRIDDLQGGPEGRKITDLERLLKAKESELEAYRTGKIRDTTLEENSHHRVMSFDVGKRQISSSDSDIQRLREVAERRHKALLRLEKEVATLRCVVEEKTKEIGELKGKIEKMQQEHAVQQARPSADRSIAKLRLAAIRPPPSPGRALTDRLIGKKSEGRKGMNYSPYRVSEYGKGGGKYDMSPIPPGARALHHSRTISERISKASPSLRSLPKASVV